MTKQGAEDVEGGRVYESIMYSIRGRVVGFLVLKRCSSPSVLIFFLHPHSPQNEALLSLPATGSQPRISTGPGCPDPALAQRRLDAGTAIEPGLHAIAGLWNMELGPEQRH